MLYSSTPGLGSLRGRPTMLRRQLNGSHDVFRMLAAFFGFTPYS
jgi:hypothetical protein